MLFGSMCFLSHNIQKQTLKWTICDSHVIECTTNCCHRLTRWPCAINPLWLNKHFMPDVSWHFCWRLIYLKFVQSEHELKFWENKYFITCGIWINWLQLLWGTAAFWNSTFCMLAAPTHPISGMVQRHIQQNLTWSWDFARMHPPCNVLNQLLDPLQL